MSYVQALLFAGCAFILSALLLFGAGLVDRWAGYDSPWKVLSFVGGVCALVSGLWALYLLLPWLTFIVSVMVVSGLIFAVIGTAWFIGVKVFSL